MEEIKTTIKKMFWDDLRGYIKAKCISDFDNLRSYFLGYLHGLLKARMITEEEQSKMENRLIGIIDYEKEKAKKFTPELTSNQEDLIRDLVYHDRLCEGNK
jgi:hypothetical protein